MLALVCSNDVSDPAQLREVEEPRPASNEALVEVEAMAINRGELHLLATRPEGWRPGQDIAGVVIEPAADGTGPERGQRVVALVDQGGWCERVAVPTNRIGALPDGVSFSAAATLPVAGLTALRALRLGGSLLGKHVLVTGAAGGVGHFAIQLARRSGARVTAVVGRPERGDGLRDLGASHVVVETDDLGGPFNLVMESAGGSLLTTALNSLAEDAVVVMYGNSSGEPASINFGRPRARIQRFFVYESGESPTFGQDLRLMAGLIASGDLHPKVGFEGTWRESVKALTALRERRVVGKAVLTID